jgi:hypothetical protein
MPNSISERQQQNYDYHDPDKIVGQQNFSNSYQTPFGGFPTPYPNVCPPLPYSNPLYSYPPQNLGQVNDNCSKCQNKKRSWFNIIIGKLSFLTGAASTSIGILGLVGVIGIMTTSLGYTLPVLMIGVGAFFFGMGLYQMLNGYQKKCRS